MGAENNVRLRILSLSIRDASLKTEMKQNVFISRVVNFEVLYVGRLT